MNQTMFVTYISKVRICCQSTKTQLLLNSFNRFKLKVQTVKCLGACKLIKLDELQIYGLHKTAICMITLDRK